MKVNPALNEIISEAHAAGRLCPPLPLVFRAIEELPPSQTRVVILGQDPYHTPGKASGLAFGYHHEYQGPIDSSLANILEEVRANTGGSVWTDETLEHWMHEGVLLLNTRLTTETGEPMAHAGLGWEGVVRDYLRSLPEGLVYMLWGREARLYKSALPEGEKLVLETSHPCRYSAHLGFQGCGHFSRANEYLESKGLAPIRW